MSDDSVGLLHQAVRAMQDQMRAIGSDAAGARRAAEATNGRLDQAEEKLEALTDVVEDLQNRVHGYPTSDPRSVTRPGLEAQMQTLLRSVGDAAAVVRAAKWVLGAGGVSGLVGFILFIHSMLTGGVTP